MAHGRYLCYSSTRDLSTTGESLTDMWKSSYPIETQDRIRVLLIRQTLGVIVQLLWARGASYMNRLDMDQVIIGCWLENVHASARVVVPFDAYVILGLSLSRIIELNMPPDMGKRLKGGEKASRSSDLHKWRKGPEPYDTPAAVHVVQNVFIWSLMALIMKLPASAARHRHSSILRRGGRSLTESAYNCPTSHYE